MTSTKKKQTSGIIYNKDRVKIKKATGQGSSSRSRNRNKNKKRLHGSKYRGQGR